MLLQVVKMWKVFWNQVTGRSWKNFEVLDRSLYCIEKNVGRNMDITVNPAEEYRKLLLLQKNRCIIMDRMLLEMNVKAASGEVSDGNKDHVTGT